MRKQYAEMPPEERRRHHEELLAELAADTPAGWQGAVVEGRATVGGGAFSTAEIESRLVQWRGPKDELEACHRLLRGGDPALVGNDDVHHHAQRRCLAGAVGPEEVV